MGIGEVPEWENGVGVCLSPAPRPPAPPPPPPPPLTRVRIGNHGIFVKCYGSILVSAL